MLLFTKTFRHMFQFHFITQNFKQHILFVTLRAKLSGAVYFHRSCLFVCGCVCLWVCYHDN